MDDQRILDVAQRLATALEPGDLDATLDRITAAAVEVLPDVQLASITVKHADGRLETFAPTDDVLLGVDAAQYELQEGPCYEAAVDAVHVTSPNLAADERFPRYAPMAVKAGIRAQAGIRLFDARGSQGALNIYSEHVGAFTDLDALGRLFAHQAAMALDYAREIQDLREAMRSRGVIGQAVGITMERFQLDEARAFGFLVRMSQHENVKLRTIAEELVAKTEAEHGAG
ncbi:GAF and ANTAR domain-containing protein [Nocardioides sp. TF02-7]|uniref:GAF and ANTAR domain-containing protein n=1 Tax=Nocardioides sp. TF02-7 TaxID=2917724 RepID=UPI001F0534A3|nr:GAF and ANTAR domain-containing protein [Nocardioides sp. TF02-7]UMG93239.1 GAF and ANTAR domain-containing protein [Nocardioides sp. TF02-7]